MSTGDSAGYRPWLDGVRGIAVLLVLIQHAGWGKQYGLGGVGVTLFFALSGYLITGLLLDEHARTGGISIRSFYLRRAARLVPALLLAVAVMDAVFLVAGLPMFAVMSLPAVFYVMNYTAVAAGYLPPSFGQTWTLAIEEHFYLVWPLIVVAMLRRISLRAAFMVTLAACAADLAWRAVLAARGADLLISVGSIERADSLLYGCAAAMAVRLGWRPRAWALPVGAAVFAAGMWLTPWLPLVSTLTGAGGALLVVGIDQARGGRVVRVALRGRSLVAVGQRSYGLYLWQQPIRAALILVVGLTGFSAFALSTVLTFAAAWASYRWIEVPIRRRARERLERQEPCGIVIEPEVICTAPPAVIDVEVRFRSAPDVPAVPSNTDAPVEVFSRNQPAVPVAAPLTDRGVPAKLA